MEAGRRVGELLRRRRLARQPELPDRFDALHRFGHVAQFIGWAVAQPQTPTLVTINELVGAEPAADPLFGLRLAAQKYGFLVGGEQVMPAVEGLVADAESRHRTDRRAAVLQHYVRRVDQIGVDVGRLHRMRLALDVGVFVDRLLGHVAEPEADDDAVNCGLAARLVAPGEGAVGKVDLDALRQQPAPQHADLLALGDGVGRDESAAYPRSP